MAAKQMRDNLETHVGNRKKGLFENAAAANLCLSSVFTRSLKYSVEFLKIIYER